MVEPPGIAPGSSPLIARAFISIVRTSPNPPNIGARACGMKNAFGRIAASGPSPDPWPRLRDRLRRSRSANDSLEFVNRHPAFAADIGRRRPAA